MPSFSKPLFSVYESNILMVFISAWFRISVIPAISPLPVPVTSLASSKGMVLVNRNSQVKDIQDRWVVMGSRNLRVSRWAVAINHNSQWVAVISRSSSRESARRFSSGF